MKYFILMLMIISSSCCTKQVKMDTNKFISAALPNVIVYKTKKDYNINVPIIMSEDKKRIISYPHPTDIIIDGTLQLPVTLENGYLLDNRGINANAVFTGYSYKEYAELNEPPTLEELMAKILDYDPFLELYECGKRDQYNSIIDDLDSLIRINDFSKFNSLLKK